MLSESTEKGKSAALAGCVLGHCLDEKRNSQRKKLSDEIERFNDNEASRREREKETGKPQASLYDKERINQLTYAMNCKQLMNDGMMIAPFLFEDPQAQRGMELMSMKLAQKNIDKVQEIAEKITDICREPLCAEQILGRLFDDYGLAMNFEQYVLVGSTVRSYLAWLLDTGRLLAEFEENMLLWRRA